MKPESELMRPGEVAIAFRVSKRTVVRWAETGKLTVVRTPGGHRRYRRSEVLQYMEPPKPPVPPTSLYEVFSRYDSRVVDRNLSYEQAHDLVEEFSRRTDHGAYMKKQMSQP